MTPIISEATSKQNPHVEEKGIPILTPSSKSRVLPEEYGGKACGLHQLSSIPGVRVPPWFALPTTLFDAHLRACGAENVIASLNDDPRFSERIQQMIRNHPLSDETVQAVKSAMVSLGAHIPLAVRSSGIVEDNAIGSFAGLFHTKLNVITIEEVCNAIKEVWASAFSEEAANERQRLNIVGKSYAMGVVIQQLVNASASAVISTIVIANGFPAIEVSANFGLGLSVVDGDVSTDSWVIHPELGYVLEEHLGNKAHQIVASLGSGVEKVSSTENKFSLTRSMLKEVYLTTTTLKKEAGCDIDVEVAFDPAGTMYTLQMRPLVSVTSDSILVVDPEQSSRYQQVASSTYSLPGVTSGKLVYIPHWSALADGTLEIGSRDIALAHMTTNAWSQHLANVSGLITKEGGATSHPMLLCREKQRPCLVGFDSDDFDNLLSLNGDEVTLDGYNRILFKGKVPLRSAKQEDLIKRFSPITLRPWPDNESDLSSLSHNQMVMYVNGKWWRKTPTFQVKGFQAEINMMRFDYIERVLERTGYKANGLYHDGFVACEMQPYHDYINAFKGVTLEEARRFNQRGRQYMERFIEICTNFTPDLWREYVDVTVCLRTFIWMSGALRYTAERNVDIIGVKLALPQYYLDAASDQIQSQFTEIDTEMQREVHELALKMVDHNPEKDIDYLRGSELYHQIITLADKYRFEHQIALHQPPNYNLAYKRLLTEVEHIKGGGLFISRKHSQSRNYLPDHPDLVGWLSLSIENRILQSDAHHLDARGKALLRNKLIEWRGEGIFEMSVEEIAND